MASSNYLRWGTALLLSILAGCSSSDKSATCTNPAFIPCSTPQGAACFDPKTDPSNCGACGVVCQAGQTCQAGLCSAGQNATCAVGFTACQFPTGLMCTSTLTDSANCGACGIACSGGKTCQAGLCTCPAGSADCTNTGVCSNLSADALNCGQCGNACGATAPMCSNSACSSSCAAGLTACNNNCVNVLADAANCGSCGIACPAGNTCVSGACKAPIPVGTGGATSIATGGASSIGVGGAGGATTAIATGGAKATGGTGATTGGSKATGGTTSAGTTLPPGTRPPGYYYLTDWSVATPDWHGCVWTGIDTVAGTTTTISPKDFTAVADGGPYKVSGTVHAAYESVALLGFNLNEAITGKSDQCKYNPSNTVEVPGVTWPSDKKGIAVNWTQGSSTLIRIQIQGPKGGTDENERWCYNVTDTSGPTYAPLSQFNTKCWGVAGSTTNPLGTYYDGSKPISAVVFLISGDKTAKPFNFTVNGFAPGNSTADAPKGGTVECGKQTGTLGSTTASEAASMQRTKITGTDCKQYIVQNNNWGNKTGSTQVIDFVGNSFTVKSSSGSSTGGGVPASFPSIYVGANGDLAGGTYSTWSNTGLPKLNSAISSANTTFKWSGGSSGGDYNACYDVWFSKNSPTAGSYNDAISGFLMVWLYKPGSRQPIGDAGNTRKATIGGQSFTVWRGKRGVQSTGTDDAGRPVITYVADSTTQNMTFDLKAFIDDAVKNAADDQTKGGTSQAFSANWYLTDVFAGFEIWTGSAATNLKADAFTFDLK